MAGNPRVRRWTRRLALACASVAALCTIIALVAWWLLPLIVRKGFERGAASLGFEQAGIAVDRADLEGLRATGMLLRMGGLEVTLDQGAADYAVSGLLGGRVSRVAIDGLTVKLDFTQPRRGVLPDAVTDLEAHFGGGGELVWPVDELHLEHGRLILVLPGGTRTINISATASRQADGRIAFDVHSENVDEELHASGVVRTETMDGEVTLHQLDVEPGFVLAVARQLGLFELPRDAVITSERVAMSGTTTLRGGIPVDFSGRVRAPRLRASLGANSVALDDLDIALSQKADARPAGSVAATVRGSGAPETWRLEPAHVRLETADGKIKGGIGEPAAFAYGDKARGRAAVHLEAGVPQLGGPAHGELAVALDGLETSAGPLAPITMGVSGWSDRLVVTVPELRLLRENVPIAVTAVRATVSNPLDATRAVEGSCEVTADANATRLLPASWKLTEPALPGPVVRVDVHATSGDTGTTATIVARSLVPRVRVTAGEDVYAATPGLELTMLADTTGASLAGGLNLDAIALPPALQKLAVNAATIGLELPKTSYATLAALADEQSTDDGFALTLKAAIARSAMTADLALALRQPAGTNTWKAGGTLAVGGINGTFAGVTLTELAGNAALDSGTFSTAQLRQWLASTDARALAQDLVPKVGVDVSVSANAIAFPGQGRAEWFAAKFTKPVAPDGGPPVAGSLSANAGIVRAGPETIEQPAVALDFAGDMEAQDVTGEIKALLEGAPLDLAVRQHATFDWDKQAVQGEGTFVLNPFTFTNSDVVTRWMPALRGVVFSGTVAAHAAMHYGGEDGWDGSARVQLTDGIVNDPPQKVRGDGLSADVSVPSLRALRTKPSQRVALARLQFGDIVAHDVEARFRTDGPAVIHIESVRMGIFDGELTAEPFSLYFPDPDVALDLRMHDLDANELVRTFQIFDGDLTGRLQGRLPVGLLAGRPIIGEGYLELEENHPARFSFDTAGFFAAGLPKRTLVEQLNRLPYELVDDGLRQLELRKFRVDLFRRDRPGTPVDISFAGTAHTRRADVPMDIDVHINGSMREVLEKILDVVMK